MTTVVPHFRFGQGVFDRLHIGLLNDTTVLGNTNLMVRKSLGSGSLSPSSKAPFLLTNVSPTSTFAV